MLFQQQLLSDSTRLRTTDDFDTTGSSRQEVEMKRAAARNMQASGGVLGALPDKFIDDLVVPSSEPVGIRLLKRMGWKPGQGIGPRVSRRQRKPEDGPMSDDDNDIPADVTFAPIDSAIITFTNKSNRQGLGYDPYKDAPEFDKSLQGQKESKYLSDQSGGTKTGFGFGTFDDDDDDDVYGSGPALLKSLDTEVDMYDRPPSRKKSKAEDSELQSQSMAPLLCSDGRPPLRGFVLAATPSKPPKWYAAPKVPRDFDPHHVFQDHIKPVGRNEQQKLTADDRAMVLGETPIDAPRRSVFEYISAENKSRLDNMLGFVMDVEGEKRLKKDHWEVPKIEKSAAEEALKGFMPFSDNIAKQNRYKQYLNIQAGISDEKIELVEGFSAEDMTKELNEFVQAARIFKPLSSSMANRFTTATKVIEFAQPAAGLRSAEETKTAQMTAPIPGMVEKMEVPKSQAAKAAAMGMFGPLTRTVVDFYPSKLLCKRFNVSNPHPEHKDLGPEKAKDLLDKKTMDNMMMSRIPGSGMFTEDNALGVSEESSEANIQDQVASVESETAQPEDEVLERPSMDIFKAIFDNSDSDSESESETEDKKMPSATIREESSSIGPDVAKPESEEAEVEPSGPFRPMFTKKSERPGQQLPAPTRTQNRSSKIDFSHLDDDEGDGDEIGPKISLIKSKSKPIATKNPISTAVKRTFDDLDDPAGRSEETLLDRNRSESPDDFIGPPAPKSSIEEPPLSSLSDDQHSSMKKIKSSTSDSHRSSSHKESSSSSRHKSSSSKSERDERSHSSSRSRHHSTSKTRRDPKGNNSDNDHGSESELAGERSDTSKDGKKRKRRSETSTTSRSKSRRHREHRSRSRSKSPSRSKKDDRDREKDRDRDKDKDRDRERDRHHRRDRDRDRERSSKRSKSDKHKSTHRHRVHDRHESDSEELWVEKKSDTSSSAPSVPELSTSSNQAANRIRASDFF
ncbi:hypothetical protein BGZ49_001382 [Haplosporangium sp. Z 27]|nr:hypothetical protein BGZ49_001382 [Haplosporangium sp. Z 27]